jgi:tRNA G37 N-methylase Trm5
MTKERVKRLKLWLEKRGFIDKSRRISEAQAEALQQCTLVSLVTLSSPSLDVSNVSLDIGVVGPLVHEQVQEYEDNISLWMAVPITVAFHSVLLAVSTSTSSSTFVFDWLQELTSISQASSVRVGVQESRVNKTLLTDGHRRASTFLDQFAVRAGLSSKAKGSYPSKYELVGDVLMIPEGAFVGQDWRFLGLVQLDKGTDVEVAVEDDSEDVSQKDNNSNSSIVDRKQVDNFWRDLANCFSVSRVARKARIHHGPKRESQVTLLYPPAITENSSLETGPGSRGWVTVVENNIAFSFDITRVMFCSGNVTERMRMARVKATNQVVVDMYCGVGYYTLPFLVYGGAKHVHACEWNPNSILALKENLRQNHVSDRCTVYPGDNALSAPLLANCADRICLGLLPTSTKSWPLAVQIAKPTGVVTIHVHENVNDVDIDQWKQDTRERFEALFLEAGKPCQVEITWLERVKSYAPHVYHVVLDLRCSSSSINGNGSIVS